MVLAGTYTPNSSSSIVFNSTGAGTHTIDTGGKTIQAITFNNTSSYQFITNNVTVTGYISHTKGTVDFNGLTVSAQAVDSTGAVTRVLSLGSSVITGTGTAPLSCSGSNLTYSANTATFICSNNSCVIGLIDGIDLNGLSIKVNAGTGNFTFSNSCTLQNLIIDPPTTKTIAVTSGKTVTLNGTLYCRPKAGQVTFTGGTISKSSGVVDLYNIINTSCTFTGGATWNTRNNCDLTVVNGLTQLGGANYVDPANGSDTGYTAYGTHSVAYTGATGTCPVLDEVATGGSSGSTAKVSWVDPYEWSQGAGTIWFRTKSAAFQAEQINLGTGGGHFHTAADFSVSSWKTFPAATKIAPKDINYIVKSPAPVNVGDGVWTDQPATLPASKSITSSVTSGGVIQLNVTGHGFVTGDCGYVQDHATGVNNAKTANGCWIVTRVNDNALTLDGSTYIADGGATGTITNVNRAVVKLTTARTLTITRCELDWTGANDAAGANTSLLNTDYKSGDVAVKVLMDAATQANKLQAYFATGTIAGATLNGYTKLSFWFKNSAAIADATTWYIALCSNADGTGILDTFPIPAIPSTARWIPLTISRCNSSFVTGGNLGGNASTAVASIAIYSGATAPTNSSNVLLDNFIACNDLNLQSLISKNTLEQGSASATGYANEGWYGIKSISQDGKVIYLDQDTNSIANYRVTSRGIGYSGGGGTFTTYIRETIKTALAASSSTVVNECLDSGIYGALIEYQGGYDTITGQQQGETFMDGLSGMGYGIQISSKTYNKLGYVCLFRYSNGIQISASTCNEITILTNLNNNGSTGINFANISSNNVIGSIINCCNNANYGINVNANNISLSHLFSINNNGNSGIYMASCFSNDLTIINAKNNGIYGVNQNIGNNNIIRSLSTINNGTAAIYNSSEINFLRNATINESTEVVGAAYSQGIIWSYNHDGQAGNHWGFLYGGTINWQTATKHASEPGSWCTAIGGTGSTTRLPDYPVKFSIGKFACVTANEQRTLTAWVKKDHATNVGCRLVVYADSVLAISEDSMTKANDTDWEALHVHFTPNRAKVVVEVFLETWYVAGNSNTYVGSVALT